jgi:predicted ABC-type ATPase
VAVAGPDGAGKTTFFQAHLRPAGLPFVNADVLAAELRLDPCRAARAADSLRRALVRRRASFAFETVFSDPAGEKLSFLEQAVVSGFEVTLCFIGLSSAALSEERVALRVSQGGHDVPSDKLRSRYPRILANLGRAIRALPEVRVYDNSDLRHPCREVAVYRYGRLFRGGARVPAWFRPCRPRPQDGAQ